MLTARRATEVTGRRGGKGGCLAAIALAVAATSCSSEPDCTVAGIVPPSLPDGRVHQAYFFQLQADTHGSDCFINPVFALGAGRLPGGMKLSEDGAIDGTPLQEGTYSFDIEVTVLYSKLGNAFGTKAATGRYSLTILPP